MLDQILNVFGIKPDCDLNLTRENQTLFDITSDVLIDAGKIVSGEKSDMVIVHGDTTTTFAASLAAYYNRVPVGHVEAGLRTFNKYAPFPESVRTRLICA